MYNQRTGTPSNDVHNPTDIVLLVVLWRIRYKLSLRDLVAARAFFTQAVATVVHKPGRVTTDQHAAYPRAIRRILGRKVQDHRAVKQHYYPMRGFGSFAGAARFLTAFDELRRYFRVRVINQKPLPRPEQRRQFKQHFADLFPEYRGPDFKPWEAKLASIAYDVRCVLNPDATVWRW